MKLLFPYQHASEVDRPLRRFDSETLENDSRDGSRKERRDTDCLKRAVVVDMHGCRLRHRSVYRLRTLTSGKRTSGNALSELLMFESFSGNYIWKPRGQSRAGRGGHYGEIDAACRPLRDAAARGTDTGTAEFFTSWIAIDQALNSPDRELRIFTTEEFEIEHCGADNHTVGRDFISDWVAERFGRPTRC
jgi:hypothetical protein